MKLDGVLGEGSTERSGGVAVHAVPFRHLRLVVLTIGFNEALNMSEGCVESIFDLFED